MNDPNVDSRRMALFAFLVPAGHHEAAWRLPDSPADRMYDSGYYLELAKTADRAGLDAVFLADAPALRTRVEHNTGGSVLEPFTLLSAMAAVTEHVGLIGTLSTTYTEPYNAARLLSSLDHISGGRAGWNMVTTAYAGAAANFGRPSHPDRVQRYKRADEFVQVVKGLWESWARDAILCDRQVGVYADPSRISRIDHAGEEFSVAGPFQSARSPQVHPLLVQAGASEPGRSFAARQADVVFSVHRDLAAARTFRTDLRRRARDAGRPQHVPLSLPGVSINLASTMKEAEALRSELDSLVMPRHSMAQILAVTGVDLSPYGLDEVLDARVLRERLANPTNTTRADEVIGMVEERPCTTVELLRRVAAARTHRVLVGPPEVVADDLDTWFRDGACDGFNLLPPALPGGLTATVDLLLPELAKRGLWWPVEGTLRERLGVPVQVA